MTKNHQKFPTDHKTIKFKIIKKPNTTKRNKTNKQTSIVESNTEKKENENRV